MSDLDKKALRGELEPEERQGIATSGATFAHRPEAPAPPAHHVVEEARCRRPNGADVALIDEFSLRRACTLQLLRKHVRVGARPFGSIAELLRQVRSSSAEPRCVILCVGARSVTELPLSEQLHILTRDLDSAPLIILSDRDSTSEVREAFRRGARGYIPTTLKPRLAAEALRIVLAGGSFFPAASLVRSHRSALAAIERPAPSLPERALTQSEELWPPRQLAVVRLLILGKSNKEIARSLTMQESTVKVHVRNIMRKLGVTNRTQAALRARELGISAGLEGDRDSFSDIAPGVAAVHSGELLADQSSSTAVSNSVRPIIHASDARPP